MKLRYIKQAYAIALILLLGGTILRISHSTGGIAAVPGIAGGICVILFNAIGIYEVLASGRLHRDQKLMWTTGLLFLGPVAGLLYYFSFRNRAVIPVKVKAQ